MESTVAAPWNSRFMPFIPLNRSAANRAIAEQMVVEKIEMPSRQPRDLGERIVDPLRIEAASAGEERVLVAEVAMLRAAAGHDDEFGHQVVATGDQIAADRRHAIQRTPGCRPVDRGTAAGAKVREKLREGLFARAEKDRVRVRRRFRRKRRHVQPAEHDARCRAPDSASAIRYAR